MAHEGGAGGGHARAGRPFAREAAKDGEVRAVGDLVVGDDVDVGLLDDVLARLHVDGVARVAAEVDGLLDGARREDAHLKAAVAAGLGGLHIVHLGGLDAADARAAAGHIDIDDGDARRGAVADALALQRDAGAGGAGHGPRSGGGGAVDHVHGRDLALALDEMSAHLGQTAGHIFGDLVLRGDGIAGKKAASGADGCLGHGLSAFHKYSCHSSLLSPYRSRSRRPGTCGRRCSSRRSPRCAPP